MSALLVAWLLLLTLLLGYLFWTVSRLFSVKDRGLKQAVLENIDGNKLLKKELEAQKQELQSQKERIKENLQKTALIRFNPFERIGGEQSYCVALLNDNNDGVVITFLYTKEGVRAYVKEVEKGKGKGVDLSNEENEAIGKAIKNTSSL